MSVIAFRPSVTVSVEEEGSGRAIEAFRFAPTKETARHLADHRLVFRARASGFQIYAAHNPEAGNVRLAPITTRTGFRFGVWLKESDFLTRYQPDLDAATGPCLYLTNLAVDGSVRGSGALSRGNAVARADAARIVARQLNARADLTKAPAPTSLKVTDLYNAARTVATVPVRAAANSLTVSVPIDLSDDTATAYVVTAVPGNEPGTTLFADAELAGRGAFGALELMAPVAPGPDPDGGRRYTMTFQRRI